MKCKWKEKIDKTWFAHTTVKIVRYKAVHVKTQETLLNKIKEPSILWFFSNEKNFNQVQNMNWKNDRWLCTNHGVMSSLMFFGFESTVNYAISCHPILTHKMPGARPLPLSRYWEVHPHYSSKNLSPTHITQKWLTRTFHKHLTQHSILESSSLLYLKCHWKEKSKQQSYNCFLWIWLPTWQWNI